MINSTPQRVVPDVSRKTGKGGSAQEKAMVRAEVKRRFPGIVKSAQK